MLSVGCISRTSRFISRKGGGKGKNGIGIVHSERSSKEICEIVSRGSPGFTSNKEGSRGKRIEIGRI